MTLPVKPQKGQPIRAELIGQIIDCLRMFRPIAGANVRTQVTPGGTIINGTPGGSAAGDATAPWTMRKHVTEGDDAGQWEIWLPPGCMSVGETLRPLNKPAKEKSGHADDKDGWYAIYLDESEGAATTVTAGGVTTVYRDFEIIAHAKTRAYLDGVDAINGTAKKYLFVSSRKILTTQESAQQTDADRVRDTWGDEFSQLVARVRVGTTTGPFRKIEQFVGAPISVQGKSPGGFDLAWDFSFASDGRLSVARLFCLRNVLAAAGISLEGPQMTELTGVSSSIWARIGTNPLNPSGAGAVEVLADPSGISSSDYVTWIRLYDMTGYAVASDLRAASLANVQVYR